MAMMVWITVKVKDGNLDQVIELADEPHGNAFTASQKGCERLERSISHEIPNHILQLNCGVLNKIGTYTLHHSKN